MSLMRTENVFEGLPSRFNEEIETAPMDHEDWKMCVNCAAFAATSKLWACMGCRPYRIIPTYYCSRSCQKADWKRHKDMCEHWRKSLVIDDLRRHPYGKILKHMEHWYYIHEDVLTRTVLHIFLCNPFFNHVDTELRIFIDYDEARLEGPPLAWPTKIMLKLSQAVQEGEEVDPDKPMTTEVDATLSNPGSVIHSPFPLTGSITPFTGGGSRSNTSPRASAPEFPISTKPEEEWIQEQRGEDKRPTMLNPNNEDKEDVRVIQFIINFPGGELLKSIIMKKSDWDAEIDRQVRAVGEENLIWPALGLYADWDLILLHIALRRSLTSRGAWVRNRILEAAIEWARSNSTEAYLAFDKERKAHRTMIQSHAQNDDGEFTMITTLTDQIAPSSQWLDLFKQGDTWSALDRAGTLDEIMRLERELDD